MQKYLKEKKKNRRPVIMVSEEKEKGPFNGRTIPLYSLSRPHLSVAPSLPLASVARISLVCLRQFSPSPAWPHPSHSRRPPIPLPLLHLSASPSLPLLVAHPLPHLCPRPLLPAPAPIIVTSCSSPHQRPQPAYGSAYPHRPGGISSLAINRD